MQFSFIRTARFLFPVSVILVIASFALMIAPGPVLSIEFTGGTLMELSLPEGKTRDDLTSALTSFTAEGIDLTSASLSQTRSGTWFVRSQTLSNEQHTALVAHLDETLGEQTTELQYTTIGPTVGSSLRQKSIWALLAACVAIILYLAAAFRKIPKALSPWTFGVAAVLALVHDIVITTGLFIILSHMTSFQLDTLFATALLSIMGYSVNDTIIIFDRIRDNLQDGGKKEDFSELADRSLNQTLSRTVNTSFSTLLVLFALLLVGSESIFWFVLALIVGTIIGTYSSFFIATPLLVFSKKWLGK